MRSIRRWYGAAIVALAAPLALISCSGSTEPAAVPTTVHVLPSPVTLAVVGKTQQFTAVVLDQRSDTMRAATVAWSTSASSVITVSTTGLATAVGNGTAQVIATAGSASGSASVTVAFAAALLAKVSGDLQTGTAGQALANPLVVAVKDSLGQAIQGATVTFSAAANAGSANPTTATTDATGQAQTTWTLGSIAGASRDTMTAGASGVTVRFVASVSAGAAAQVAKTAGDFQKTATGQAVAIPPKVTVEDQFGNAVAGDSVVFAVASGGGSLTGASQVSNAAGQATVGSWTVGAAPGVNTLTATAKGVATPATFTDTAYTPGAPAAVFIVSGTNNQPGLVGYAVNVRPAVRVLDASNNPVPSASVTFAVATGGGSGTGLVATTNVNGVAQVGSWVLGGAPGVNTMTATASGVTPATFADTGVAGAYTIQLQYYGTYKPTPVESLAFNSAVAKWQSIIYRHVSAPIQVTDTANTCGAGDPALNTSVTDILILASFDSIDGKGKTLAQAGPCFLRVSGPGAPLTLVGIMKFDTADVQSLITAGQLNLVVEHEMGHVLGFGTIWTLPSPFPNLNCLQLPSNPPGTILDTYFACPAASNALAQFDSLGGTSYTGSTLSPPGSPSHAPPVENCGASSPSGCGAGTVNSHWREPVFTNELMTGYLNTGPNPLSSMTAASMQDLGYTVNYAGADAYVHTFTAPATGGAALFMGDDIHHGPLFAVDPFGRITLIRARQ